MGAQSKRARRVRRSGDFAPSVLRGVLKTPPTTPSVYSWTLEEIRAARDAQLRGDFRRPSALAVAMRTDDALAVARANRLAPQRCIRVEIVPAGGARGEPIAREAEALYGDGGLAISDGTRADINGCLVDHGVAFAYNVWTPREDGSRVDVSVYYWPIEFVRWDSAQECYVARVDPASTDGGFEVPIVHGDGRWIVFALHDHMPFQQDAAVLPASLVWARHAHAVRDWAKSSVAHGSAKVIGEMPAGVPLQDSETGEPTADALAFVTLLQGIGSDEAVAGLRPAGSKTDFLANTSSAWQIFAELVANAETASARIYLGTDGTLGSKGGAPGVDVQALFGVAATKVQGDLTAIERGLHTGSIEVWTALNFGDSKLAPRRRYMLPDVDAEADREALAKRTVAFFDEIDRAKAAGFAITPEYVERIAKKHGVDAPPLPAPAAALPAPATPLAVVR